MKLADMMIQDVIQAAPEESIAEAAKRMRERSVGCLIVTAGGAVKGIITDRDLLACLAQKHDPYRCAILQHMKRPVVVLGPEEDHVTAAGVLSRKCIKRLPIAQSGKLLGIVSLSDLARLASAEAERLGSALSFFKAVVQAQSAQWTAPAMPIKAAKSAAEESMLSDSDSRDELIDLGGPG